MNKILLPAVVAALILTGCAQHYVLTMSNGERIRTGSKPRLERGFYYFKNASGRDAPPVFAGRVREVAPASMATPDQGSTFKPVQSR